MLLSFTNSNCHDFIANDEGPPNHPTSIYWIIKFGVMLESYHKLQLKPKTVPKFKHVVKLIWFALPEKGIDNAVKDCCKQLQACVSANTGHFEHIM